MCLRYSIEFPTELLKINADKLNNRDNENGDTDEIIKNIGVMNKLASQLEDMIHADRACGFCY